MNIPEDIFDKALTRLLDGESVNAIVHDYPEYQQELVSLLSVSEYGLNIPRLTPPTPHKRRLYAEKKNIFTSFADMLLFTRAAIIPIALLITFLGGRSIVSATESSLPGDTLYTLKRASENARLTFTRNPEKLAVIHVELMQKRVDEVRKAADMGDQTAENAAIAELQSQSAKTFAEAAPVATANAISKQDSSLLDTLLAVNKEQKDVLQDVQQKEDPATSSTATTALEDNKKNDQTLAKIIATVNDQAIADLPNKVSVTGNITSHYGKQIIIEKNTFTIDDKTTITDIDGQINSNAALTGRAAVVGIKSSTGLNLAKQIVLLPPTEGETTNDGSVKGVTTKPVVKPNPKPTTNSNTNATQENPTDNTQTPTNQAMGTFIPEPSAQEYEF